MVVDRVAASAAQRSFEERIDLGRSEDPMRQGHTDVYDGSVGLGASIFNTEPRYGQSVLRLISRDC